MSEAAARACARCGTPLPAAARFCMQCGTAVEATPEGERRVATVLFADIVGSTDLAVSLDPEDMRARLAAFYDGCRSVIDAFGGRVEKFIGDAVMAVFGVPRAFGDDADRAVAAALALIETVDAPLRVGVNTGEVLAVSGGDGSLAVAGEAVHAAARLQSAAAPGQVLLGERTAHALRSVSSRAVGVVPLKGFPDPVPVWEAMLGPLSEGNGVPFVGREVELGMLRLAHERSCAQPAAQLCVFAAEPGSGKTRLLSEFATTVAGSSALAVLRSSPVHAAMTRTGLARLASALVGAPDDSGQQLLDRLRAELTDAHDPHPEETARWVARSAGVSVDDRPVSDEQVASGWIRLIRIVARRRPVVVIVDDVQWADAALLQILGRVLAGAADLPVLVVYAGRPELDEVMTPHLPEGVPLVRFELLPLHDADAHALVRQLLPASRQELAETAVRRAGGNPFFLGELARTLREVATPDAALLPDTVQTSIAARLDALPAQARRVVQRAAVLGLAFSLDDVRALEPSATHATIDALARADLVVPDEDRRGGWRFRHPLIREVAHGQLTKAARAELHEQAAARFVADPEVVAEHLSQSAALSPSPQRRAGAAAALLDAANAALGRGAGMRAQQLFEVAAEHFDEPAERISVLQRAAQLAWSRRDGDEAVRLFDAVADAAATVDDRATETDACLSAAEIMLRFAGVVRTHGPSDADVRVRRAEKRVPADQPRLAAYLDGVHFWQQYWKGEPSAEDVDRISQAARSVDDPRLVAMLLDAAAAVAWMQERARDAATITGQRWSHVELIDNPLLAAIEQVDTLVMAAECALQSGDLDYFGEVSARLYDVEARRGSPITGIGPTVFLGYLTGDWDRMLSLAAVMHEAWLASGRVRATYLLSAIYGVQAVYRLRGDTDGVARFRRMADQIGAGNAFAQYTWKAVIFGDTDVHLGRPERAVERFAAIPETSQGYQLRSLKRAVRAEALVHAKSAEADAALAEAAESIGDDRVAAGFLARAVAIHRNDRSALDEAVEHFDQLGMIYQLARTLHLRRDEDRRKAERTFAALGVPTPTTP